MDPTTHRPPRSPLKSLCNKTWLPLLLYAAVLLCGLAVLVKQQRITLPFLGQQADPRFTGSQQQVAQQQQQQQQQHTMPGPTVAVVGSGLAGLAAAYELSQALATQLPAARVVVFEKNAMLGGNSMKASSGINAINPAAGDSQQIFAADTRKSGGGLSKEDLLETLVGRSEAGIAFLQGLGLDLSSIVRLGGHSKPRTRSNPSGPNVGFYLVKAVAAKVEAAPNVDVRKNTKTFMDQREQLWDFLCTCYGCQYALSRVAVFCNTYQLRAGQHLIFYRDVLKRLRIAVISNMPGKLLQELASCSDSLPCKQQLLLPELSYPSSSEEPTDTAEAEDDEQPPSAAAQQASAASDALAAWHTAAVGTNAAAGCQQQALQFVLQGVAAGTTALKPAALADGCGEISACRIHDPTVASILADKTNWQLLQRQALVPEQQQQPWRTTACGSEGPWATASDDAAEGAVALVSSSSFSLSNPNGLSLECEERLDELESPRPGATSTSAHLLQVQQQQQRLQSEAVAGAPAACAPGHQQQQQQLLDVGLQDQAQAGETATACRVTVAAVAARKSSRPAGGHSSAAQKQAGNGGQDGLGRKRLLEGLAGTEPEPEQPCPAASTGGAAGGCFSRLAADCCFSSGPAGKKLRDGTCSFPAGGAVVAGASAPGHGGPWQQQEQQLDNGIGTSLTTSALPGAAGSLVAFHPGAAVTDPGPVQQQSNQRPALPSGCRLLHAGSLVLERGASGRAAASGAGLPSITCQASGLSGTSSAAAPAGQQQGLAACAGARAPGVAATSLFGHHRSDSQQLDLSSKLLELEEWSAIAGLLAMRRARSK